MYASWAGVTLERFGKVSDDGSFFADLEVPARDVLST